MTRTSTARGALVALIVTACVAAACGAGHTATRTPTTASTSAPWWSHAARFAPSQGYVTYISNMAALSAKFGAPQPMLTCSQIFGSPTPAGLDGIRAANSHGGLPELFSAPNLASVESDAGFDPCSAPIIVDGTLGYGTLPSPTAPDDIGFDVYAESGDGSTVISTLTNEGYTQRRFDNATVLSKGADGAMISDTYFSKLDRVAVVPGWVVTAHSTATMQLALDAYTPTTAARDTLSVRHSMLNALGDFDAVAILDQASSSQQAIAFYVERALETLPRTWGTLAAPSHVALAYERAPEHPNQLKIALYYADGAGGQPDAGELSKRLDSYQSIYFHHPLCTASARASVTRANGSSLIVATCQISDDVTLSGLVVIGDLGFLIARPAP